MDKKLATYLRMLSYKMTQIVVQSRLGCKIHTTAQPESSKYCFHITIDDIPEVTVETRRALNNRQIDEKNSLSIEISLKTVTDESMTVEIWTLEMHNEKTPQEQQSSAPSSPSSPSSPPPPPSLHPADDSGSDSGDDRDSFSVYNRMSGMLKALLSITRTTPAYKLSRGQAPDSYVMCYRIRYGRPDVELLGDDCESMQVGRVKTSIGEIVMRGTYRTRMTIDQPRDLPRDQPRDQRTGASEPTEAHDKSKSSCLGTCLPALIRKARSGIHIKEMGREDFWSSLSFDDCCELLDNMKPMRGAFAIGPPIDDKGWDSLFPGGAPFPLGNEVATMVETQPDGTKKVTTQTFRILRKLPFDPPDIPLSTWKWSNEPEPTCSCPKAVAAAAAAAASAKKSPPKPKPRRTAKPKKRLSDFGDLSFPFAEPRDPRNLVDFFLQMQRPVPAQVRPEGTIEYMIPIGTVRQQRERRQKEIRRVMRRKCLTYKAAEATLPPPPQPISEFIKEAEQVSEELAEFIRKYDEMKLNEESGGSGTAASAAAAADTTAGGGGGGGGGGGSAAGGNIDFLLD